MINRTFLPFERKYQQLPWHDLHHECVTVAICQPAPRQSRYDRASHYERLQQQNWQPHDTLTNRSNHHNISAGKSCHHTQQTDLPTPEPAIIPIRWPWPTVSKLLITRTPTSSCFSTGRRARGLACHSVASRPQAAMAGHHQADVPVRQWHGPTIPAPL